MAVKLRLIVETAHKRLRRLIVRLHGEA